MAKFDTSKYRGKDLLHVPERELVQYLLNESSSLYWYFDFIMEPAVGPIPRSGWDYLLFAEIPRADLGLKPGQPGDIDVLIIPTLDGKPRPDLGAAIEVKRLALKGPNWQKNVDRYGISQANGLLKAGFPYVGILHLIVNAPGPTENWKNLHEYKVVGNTDHIEFVRELNVDMTGPKSAERQLKRLLSQNPHPAIGLNCVAISQMAHEDGEPSWLSVTDPERRNALRNPYAHPIMIANLAALAEDMLPYMERRPADVRR